MKNKLSTQEKDFVKEVIKTGNLTQSVKKAYNEEDDNYAGVKGQRLIRKDKIKELIEPVVTRWQDLRDRLTEELENKDLSRENMRDITNTIDTLTKNIQLLTGGKTENNGIGELAETLNSWINSKK